MKKKLMFLLMILISNSSFAAKTNNNQVTDLFDKNIINKEAYFNDLNKQSTDAISNIKSNKSVGLVEGSDQSARMDSQYNSIKAIDLDNAGTDKRNSNEFKFYDENEFEPDYTKPGNHQHKLDADDIGKATSKLMGNLMHLLNDLKFDCKTVKGPIQKEPIFHIDIKREQQKNTEYDQLFCEEPRGRYICNEELDVKCIRRGFTKGPWQYRTIRISGAELHHAKEAWGFAKFRDHKEWDWYITPYHPKPHAFFGYSGYQVGAWVNEPNLIINDARNYISAKLGIPLNQIREDIVFPPEGRGVGPLFWGVGRWRKVWTEYEFGYYYRDLISTCQVWGEEWNERCTLQ